MDTKVLFTLVKPNILDSSKYFFPISLNDILEVTYTYGKSDKAKKKERNSNVKTSNIKLISNFFFKKLKKVPWYPKKSAYVNDII